MTNNSAFNYEFWQKQGKVAAVEGNAPISLTQGNRCFLVLDGGMDIFTVALADGQPISPHQHLTRILPDQVFFDLPVDDRHNIGIVAVSLPQTRLLEMPLQNLQALGQQDQCRSLIIGWLDRWLETLSQFFSSSLLPPKTGLLLHPDQEYHLQSGQAALVDKGLIWVSCSGGPATLVGLADLPAPAEPQLLPLTSKTWLTAPGEIHLKTFSTEQYLQSDPQWQGLNYYYQLLGIRLADQYSQWQEEERTNYNNLKKQAQTTLEGSFTRLAAVLQPKDGLVWTDYDHSLLAACQLVGKSAGIEITEPPRFKKSWTNTILLQEIARVSRFRVRHVQLEGEWWHNDYGPILAFRKEDGGPVALIPLGPRRYRLDDPESHESMPVTPEIAASLDESGYIFYRPLPQVGMTAWQLIKFSMRGMQSDLWMLVLMGLANGLIGLILPITTGILYDSVIPQDDRSQLFQLTVILLIMACCSAMFTFTRNLAMLRIEGRMDYTLQSAVWDHLLKMPSSFFKKYSAGDLAMRADAVTFMRQQLSSSTITSILASIFSIFSFALLFYYSWELSLVAAVIIFISSLITIIFGYWQLKYKWPMYDIQGRISGLALQLFIGLPKLHVAGAEEKSLARWSSIFSENKVLALKSRTFANVLATINAVLPLLATGFMYYWVAIFSHIKISTGDLMAFMSSFGTFYGAMLGLSSNLVSILNVVPLYKRVRPILEGVPEIDDTKKEPPEIRGAIELANVSFRYDQSGPHILNDVSFRVKPGEFVALVGPSGTGKSTIFRLLLGFEKPESGSVYFDGLDLAGMDMQAVRRQMGVVLQDGKLIPGDILSNIIGTADLSEDDAWEAARMAGLEEDIKAMPMGIHTFISEGGGTFSGGQMQRLLIARAIVKKPRILLFDEATSALDNQTQAIVSRSLQELRTTRIVIAHRLSTIIQADRILVVDRGAIQQSGSYEELIKQPGLFAELAKRQIV